MRRKVAIVQLILLFFILLVGYKLRIKNYDQVPFPGESMDEYSFSWVGLSLIETGYPVGVSGIKGYPSYDYRYVNVDRVFQKGANNGNPLSINYPWFDHPPLLGLLTGGFAYIKGARVFEDTIIFLIRKPMIFLGTLTILLIFIFSKIIYGFKEAAIASTIYATSPLIVIASRMVQAENGMIPLFLLSLIFLAFYFKKRKELFLWLGGISAGISTLFKISGIAAVVAGIIIIFINSQKRNKELLSNLLIFGCTALSFLSLFVLFGAATDIKLFFEIIQSNSNRFYGIGSNAIQALITTTKITNLKYLTDAWPLAGWFSLAMLTFGARFNDQKNDFWIIIPAFLYLFVYLLFGSEPHGWYWLPLWPFLIIAISRVISLALEDIRVAGITVLLILLPLGTHLSKIIDITKFQRYSVYWRMGIPVLLVICLGGLLTHRKSPVLIKIVINAIVIALLLAAICLNLKYLSIINVDYWYHAT